MRFWNHAVVVLTIVAPVTVSAVGCVTSPSNRSEVSTSTSTIYFDGYYIEGGALVSLEAQHPTTGAWTTFATTTTQTGRISLHGMDWHYWERGAIVPASYWRAGAAGAMATLRMRSGSHTLRGMEENWLDCVTRYDDIVEVERECTTGSTVTVCTSNYLPFSARRSPCPPRSIVGIQPSGDQDRWQLPDTTTTIVPSVAPASMRWRGDTVSFVDVFDAVPSAGELPSLTGVNVVRIFYPNNRDSNVEVSFNPDAIAPSLGVPRPSQLPWRGTRTFRQYDRGQCSAFLSWREILDNLGPVLDLAANGATIGAVQVTAQPLSRTTLRPVLRPSGEDAIAFAQGVALQGRISGGPWINLGRIYAWLSLRLTISGGRLSIAIEPENTQIDYQPPPAFTIAEWFGVTSEAEVEGMLKNELEAELPGAVRAGLPAVVRAFNGMKRIHGRPDGVEVVLAETTQDPNYSVLNGNGLCSRPAVDPSPLATGLLFTLFDPPSPTDPPTFGDQP